MASTIQVDKITDIGGNTMIESNGSGTFTNSLPAPTSGIAASAIDSGTIATARLGSGTASSSTFLRGDQTYAAAGGDNTPSFSVYLSANQSINSDSHTKVTFDSEYWDTDNAFASNKFTVPSGEGGKYAIAASLGWRQWNTSAGSVTADKRIQIQVYINGSGVNTRGLLQTNNTSTESGQNNISVSTAGTIELSAGDYIEVYATHNTGHSAELYYQYTWFTGHKLIGV